MPYFLKGGKENEETKKGYVGVLQTFKINCNFLLKETSVFVEYNSLLRKWSIEAYVNRQGGLFRCFPCAVLCDLVGQG